MCRQLLALCSLRGPQGTTGPARTNATLAKLQGQGGTGWGGGRTELVCLHSPGWGIGRNSPALGTGEIKLPTNGNSLFFLVFMVISPGLPFFDVGCAYPVDQPQPRCCSHLVVSLLCQAAEDALTTSPAVSRFPLIPSSFQPAAPARTEASQAARQSQDKGHICLQRNCQHTALHQTQSQICCAGLDLCLPGAVGRILGPCCPMSNEQCTLRVLWML